MNGVSSVYYYKILCDYSIAATIEREREREEKILIFIYEWQL